MTSAMIGDRVLSRWRVDGFYYPGQIIHCVQKKHVLVCFDMGILQNTEKQFLIKEADSAANRSQAEKYVLMKSRPWNGLDIVRYVPAIITFQKGKKKSSNSLTVVTYREKQLHVAAKDVVRITQKQYFFILKHLSRAQREDHESMYGPEAYFANHKAITVETVPSDDLPIANGNHSGCKTPDADEHHSTGRHSSGWSVRSEDMADGVASRRSPEAGASPISQRCLPPPHLASTPLPSPKFTGTSSTARSIKLIPNNTTGTEPTVEVFLSQRQQEENCTIDCYRDRHQEQMGGKDLSPPLTPSLLAPDHLHHPRVKRELAGTNLNSRLHYVNCSCISNNTEPAGYSSLEILQRALWPTMEQQLLAEQRKLYELQQEAANKLEQMILHYTKREVSPKPSLQELTEPRQEATGSNTQEDYSLCSTYNTASDGPRELLAAPTQNELRLHSPILTQNSSQQTESPKEHGLINGQKLCSECEFPPGTGDAIINENLNIFLHTHCFQCGICKGMFGDTMPKTDALIQNGILHCSECYEKSKTVSSQAPNRESKTQNKETKQLNEASNSLNKESKLLNKESELLTEASNPLNKEFKLVNEASNPLNKVSMLVNEASDTRNKESMLLCEAFDPLNKGSMLLSETANPLNKESKLLNESEPLINKSKPLINKSNVLYEETKPLNVDSKRLTEDLIEQVLVRNHSTGWYNRGRLIHDYRNDSFLVQIEDKNVKTLYPQDVIRDSEDKSTVLKVGDAVMCPYPTIDVQYCPAVVLQELPMMWLQVRYYDGTEGYVAREEAYLINDAHKHETITDIIRKEEAVIGRTVVARNDKDGIYYIGTVAPRDWTGPRFLIEWTDGSQSIQEAMHMSAVLPELRNLGVGSHVLALANSHPESFAYMPGIVMKTDNKQWDVHFINGKRALLFHRNQMYWLSEKYYKLSEMYFEKKQRKT